MYEFVVVNVFGYGQKRYEFDEPKDMREIAIYLNELPELEDETYTIASVG